MKQHLDQCSTRLSSEYGTSPNMKSFLFFKSVTRCKKSWVGLGQGLHDSLRLCLSCDLLGTLQQSVVNIFGTGDLRLDHAEVLGIGHGLCLHGVWLGGCWDQVG